MEGENNQELPKPCKSGCGFFGHHNFGGRCSKCFKNLEKESSTRCFTESTKIPLETDKKLATLMDAKCIISEAFSESNTSLSSDLSTDISSNEVADLPASQQKKPNRCFQCHKKVNLMGFSCRCGHVFCTTHRYSEAHNCQYDYREEAQEEIRKANPVVVAKKVEKI